MLEHDLWISKLKNKDESSKSWRDIVKYSNAKFKLLLRDGEGGSQTQNNSIYLYGCVSLNKRISRLRLFLQSM